MISCFRLIVTTSGTDSPKRFSYSLLNVPFMVLVLRLALATVARLALKLLLINNTTAAHSNFLKLWYRQHVFVWHASIEKVVYFYPNVLHYRLAPSLITLPGRVTLVTRQACSRHTTINSRRTPKKTQLMIQTWIITVIQAIRKDSSRKTRKK